MTNEEFINGLTRRYSDYNDITLMDINAYIKYVADKDELLKAIIDNYAYQKAPNVAAIRKIARDSNIGEQKRGSKYLLFNRCRVCNTPYSFKGRGCPKCKKMTDIIVVKALEFPEGMIFTKPDCFCCESFDKKPLGSVCEHWGRDIPLTPQDRKMCRDCTCSKCCSDEKKNNIDRGIK